MPFKSQGARKAFFAEQKSGQIKKPGYSNAVIGADKSQTMQNKIAGTPLVPMSNPVKQLKFPKLRKKLLGM